MDKLLKFLGLPGITAILGVVFIFILALYFSIQKSCDKSKEKTEPNGGITRETTNSTLKIDFEKLKFEMNEFIDKEYTGITQMPTNEYVKDNIGLYYSMDIKDSDSPSPTVILFPPGEYSYKDNEPKFIKSLGNVNAKVLSGVLKDVKYKIFVEGQADKAGDITFTRKFLPNYTYSKIEYYTTYKSNTATKIFYDSKPTTIALTEPLKNSNLPLLRASYLNEKLLAYGSHIPKPVILEGEVKNEVGADYRNGKIILFIDTTQNQK